MKEIHPEIMNKILGGTQGQLDIISKNYQAVADNLEDMRANQNQQMLALATIYDALKAIAEKTETKLPEPRIDMEITEADD
jgi:hypothetical protein